MLTYRSAFDEAVVLCQVGWMPARRSPTADHLIVLRLYPDLTWLQRKLLGLSTR